MRKRIYNYYDLMEYFEEEICPHCNNFQECSEWMGDSPSTILKFDACIYKGMGDAEVDIEECESAIEEYIEYGERTGL